MENKRVCPECGDPVYGRVDKKFCSDQCRNAFNNRNMGYTNNHIRRINAILRRNRKTLEMLNPNGKAKVHLNQLKKHGFDFNYHTHQYITKNGNVYFFCYEHGYLKLDNDFFALVTREY
jgi:predicted nucleic acid-binding Zn ribbon protein